MADEFWKYPEETPETKTTIKTGILKIEKLRNPLLTKMNPIIEYDYRNLPGLMQGCKIASFQQSARCPVVSQPFSGHPYSEVVGGETKNVKQT
jgi:hypothetical protein